MSKAVLAVIPVARSRSERATLTDIAAGSFEREEHSGHRNCLAPFGRDKPQLNGNLNRRRLRRKEGKLYARDSDYQQLPTWACQL